MKVLSTFRRFDYSTFLLLACAAGCTRPGMMLGITFRAAPDGVQIAPDPRESDEHVDASQIDLVAAANEAVAFRLWAAYHGALPVEVSVVADDWQGPDGAALPSDSIQLYRVHTVTAPYWPGWHIRTVAPDRRPDPIDDVLIPVRAPHGGLPYRLSNGESLALWADVSVPKDAKPGVYLSKLRARTGRGAESQFAVRLEVLPCVLPDTGGVVLLGDIDHEGLFAHHVTHEGKPYRPGRVLADSPVRDELQAVLDASMRLLQSHKVCPILSGLRPVMKIDAEGDVTVRWDDYDALVSGYLDGAKFFDRAPLPLWMVPFDERFPTPPSREALESPAYAGYVRKYLAECARHFSERGWLERSFARLPHARAPGRDALAASEHFAKLIRRAAPELRIVSELFPQDMSPYGWSGFPVGDLVGYVDVWCPPAQFYPSPEIRAALVPPQHFWVQVDRPPFSGSLEVVAGPTDARVIPWQARQEGAGAVLLGPLNAWPEPRDGAGKLSAQECIDFAARRGEAGAPVAQPLIYPGSIAGLSEPLPSIRLKRLRRGMFDLAWLQLLGEKGAGHIAEVMAESLAPFAAARAYGHHYASGRSGGWATDPSAWREAERIMVDELRAVLAGSPGRTERMAATVRWRRFMESVRRQRAEVESARIVRVGRGERAASTLQCALVLRNAARDPMSGSARFGLLPIGWSSREKQVAFGPIAPGGASRVALSATATAVAWDEDGVQYLPIELFAGDDEPGAVRRLSARLAYIAAQSLAQGKAARRIRIDGDLADWPGATGNLASDFVLITGEDPAAPAEAGTRPRSRTRVSVAVDTEALYFGFDCSMVKEGAGVSPVGHTNAVRYEDMIPVGDELVEIILDPAAAGTHSPADLFHVVVKPGGALWERGVALDPPVGRREVWAADIQYAAKVHGERWTAEVRIPLSAFGPAAVRQPVWAVNFSRFDARNQEYSTWSGATGDFYDPAAMGNLALP